MTFFLCVHFTLTTLFQGHNLDAVMTRNATTFHVTVAYVLLSDQTSYPNSPAILFLPQVIILLHQYDQLINPHFFLCSVALSYSSSLLIQRDLVIDIYFLATSINSCAFFSLWNLSHNSRTLWVRSLAILTDCPLGNLLLPVAWPTGYFVPAHTDTLHKIFSKHLSVYSSVLCFCYQSDSQN